MQCPVCRGGTKVLDSRDGRDGAIRRRRCCTMCGHRFTTKERVEAILPSVVKRDGSRQPFDGAKILRGLELACRKRPVRPDELESLVVELERWALTRGDREISVELLGERIMQRLHGLDAVAYVRFVSVYRSFDTIDEFRDLLALMDKAARVDLAGQRTLFTGQPRQDSDHDAGSKTKRARGSNRGGHSRTRKSESSESASSASASSSPSPAQGQGPAEVDDAAQGEPRAGREMES